VNRLNLSPYNLAGLSLICPDIRGRHARGSRVVVVDSARVDGLFGLESIAFSGRPIPLVALARPTKGWPSGVTGTWPRVRPSRLLVDPEHICPQQTVNNTILELRPSRLLVDPGHICPPQTVSSTVLELRHIY
jgi:hypothetical protein